MKLSISTIFGIIVSLAMLLTGVFSITGRIDIYEIMPVLQDYHFLNLPSLFIVLGGILNSIFIMYPGRYVAKAWGSIFHLFTQSKTKAKTLQDDVKRVISWSQRIKQDKMNAYTQIQDENHKEVAGFLFSLVSTKYSNEEIREFGENSIEEQLNRKLVTVEVLSSMGTTSPAFGMFGTLFGLIIMLSQLDNPSEMGPGLAAALITTLYGISLAHLIFFPLARKLRNLAQIERFRDYLILEGVLLINENKSPFYIQDKLSSFLQRDSSIGEDEVEGSAKKAA